VTLGDPLKINPQRSIRIFQTPQADWEEANYYLGTVGGKDED